ncbi:hypothetical protein SAY86_028208 [Trapa natans]|uniref:Uncharacterized protein n=1 Tax=Trapa natans TaxID=22666 RepID=A0AAN7M0N3_TRANT|nr:hypothetical protein SAY86_028208 [Trapa natans]
MSSKNPNSQGFYLEPNGMILPPPGPFAAASATKEYPRKKVRKPYTSTKKKERWTDTEHAKFVEAVYLFDRDWKKIQAFIASKTVIQIRSHAQKYSGKIKKNGVKGHLPPPRPKRKAAHPYHQKASKNAQVQSQASESLHSSPALVGSIDATVSDSSSILSPPFTSAKLGSWGYNTIPKVNLPHASRGTYVPTGCSGISESTQRMQSVCVPTDQGHKIHKMRVLPDFYQVYCFIGSFFDPDTTGHLQNLKRMHPIDIKTVLLLMKNLFHNLTSPDFEDQVSFTFSSASLFLIYADMCRSSK